MKKMFLFLVLGVSFLTGCTSDTDDDSNAIDLNQYEETFATGKDDGSSPGDKDGDGE